PLVHEELGLLRLRRDLERVGPELLQPRGELPGGGGFLCLLGLLVVLVRGLRGDGGGGESQDEREACLHSKSSLAGHSNAWTPFAAGEGGRFLKAFLEPGASAGRSRARTTAGKGLPKWNSC